MPLSNNNQQQSASATQLYELLLARNFEIDILDSSGQQITDPTKAEVFSFDYRTEHKDYGTVVILLTPENTLEIFYGDNLGRGMERDDRETWYDFLYQIRMFAKRNLFSFELKNMNKLKYTMQGMAALKEGLFESYYGNKKTSYSDGPQKTRLIINHNKQLEANDPRYRYIESIFVETEDGERFKLPFNKLAAGRAMARHVAEGGRPYDPLGQHICSMVETIGKLGKFVRKLGRREMTAETELAASAHEKYNEARKTLKRIASAKGYAAFKESWNPAQITESDRVMDQVDHLLQENYSATENKNMKELQLFESWVNRITEGNSSALDTPEKIQQLVDLLSEPLEVGPDAMNAQELLYDLVGDDTLFDQLSDLASQDPTADARDIVIDWMRSAQHSEPGYAEVLSQVDGVSPQIDEGDVFVMHREFFEEIQKMDPSLFEDTSGSEQLVSTLAEFNTTTPTIGQDYIYVSVVASPALKVANVAYSKQPHTLVNISENSYFFEIDGKTVKYPDSGSHNRGNGLEYVLVFDSPTAFSRFWTWFTMTFNEGNNWRISSKVLDQGVAEEIGNPLDDPEFGGDDEDTSEFYVIIYDEDEDSTFVGKLQQTDRRWEEIAVAGQAPNQWGGGYMSYISPQDIMNWLFQDYRRGYTVKGPYYSKQEALQVAHNEFGIREDARGRSEYQANIHLAGGAKQKLPNKQFTDFAAWRKYMTAFDPTVKFFKKTTPHGEIILARTGDRVLGSFSPANKFGFMGEARVSSDDTQAIREFKETVSKIV